MINILNLINSNPRPKDARPVVTLAAAKLLLYIANGRREELAEAAGLVVSVMKFYQVPIARTLGKGTPRPITADDVVELLVSRSGYAYTLPDLYKNILLTIKFLDK